MSEDIKTDEIAEENENLTEEDSSPHKNDNFPEEKASDDTTNKNEDGHKDDEKDEKDTRAKEEVTEEKKESSDRRPGARYSSPAGKDQRFSKFKRKVCRFCTDKNAVIDYKRADILGRFITDRGKILPRRVTGTCARHQRDLARAIKRARIIALLPFLEK